MMPRTITYTYTETHCADCVFHKSQLWLHRRIGGNEYRHYCQHSNNAHEQGMSFEPRGRFIGGDDIVPNWCPLNGKDGEQ